MIVLDYKFCTLHSRHIDIFFNKVKPMFLAKNWRFSLTFFWEKMGLEIICDDHLHVVKENQALLVSNIEIMVFHSSHI